VAVNLQTAISKGKWNFPLKDLHFERKAEKFNHLNGLGVVQAFAPSQKKGKSIRRLLLRLFSDNGRQIQLDLPHSY
jgi:hypothetical protein